MQAVEAGATAQATVADSVAKRPLRGPAGEFVFGSETQGVMLSDEQIASMTSAELMAWQTQQSKDQFKDLLKNPFGSKKAPPPPMAPVSSAPVDRARQIDLERVARDAARRPYLAEHRPPVVFSRLATRSKTQIEEVTAYLASSGLAGRPDLVYGVYRVPDHISPGHCVAIAGASSSGTSCMHPPAGRRRRRTCRSRRGSTARRVGSTGGSANRRSPTRSWHSPTSQSSGVGPERCLGIARSLEIRSIGGGDGETSHTISRVTGVHAFHPAGLGAGASRPDEAGDAARCARRARRTASTWSR